MVNHHVGALWLIIMLERYLLHTQFIFSILASMMFVLSIISIFSTIINQLIQFLIAIALPGFFIIIGLLYLYVAIKSSCGARQRSLGIIFGLVIMMIGFLFGSSLIGNYFNSLELYEIRILIEPL